MRRPIQHREDITVAAAKAQLAQMLSAATDKAFAAYTVDFLASVNRTPRREIEYMLGVETGRRQRRAEGAA